jgi:hypothetical protein
MELVHEFNQGNLTESTGEQFPLGVCRGLVVQWLISIKDNNQKVYWKDLYGSLSGNPDTPLLGIGYARKAIEHQEQYMFDEDYSQKELNENSLTWSEDKKYNIGIFTPNGTDFFADTVLNADLRYFILSIIGTKFRHAIGVHRTYSVLGKSKSVQIFDPNLGEYSCEGREDIINCLGTIGNIYNGDFNTEFILRLYKS